MDKFINNEDWRFGGPLSLVRTLLARLEEYTQIHGSTQALTELADMRTLGGDMFLDLIRMHSEELEIIKVPANCTDFKQNISRLFKGGEHVACPITIIHLAQGAHAYITETYESKKAGASFIAGAQLLILEEGAQLHYNYEQKLHPDSHIIILQESQLHKDALLKQWSCHQGASWARQELVCRLLASGAEALLSSGNKSTGTQRLDLRSFQAHEAPHTRSSLLYKNVIADQATACFSGQILVAENAHEVDAYQSNKNLLLSPQAQVHSLPGLEILADQVRCSHGSACSGIDPEHLFYLESRGIPNAIAETMIADGFLASARELLI